MDMGAKAQGWLLLALAGVFITSGMVAVAWAGPGQADIWAGLAIWAICAMAGNLLLNRYLPRCDVLLFPLVMFLSGWGLVAIERLAPPFADRQALWLIISVLALLIAALSPQILIWLRRYRHVLFAVALSLLLATIVLGRNPSGFEFAPRLWLGFGGIYFQPSEAMKIALVVFLASYLGEQSAREHGMSARLIGPLLLMWLLSVVILVWQRDLGTAMLFFIVFLLLLYLASGDLRIILGGGVLMMIAGLAAYQLFDVVQLRVDIWLNPWLEANDRAYQIVQSLMAFAAGGLFGAGAGLGSPGYIPVVHSDFIFAALAEEWGLLGVITVLSCFAALAWRGFSIAQTHPGDGFHKLLAVGLTMMLVIQGLMIMAGVLKLLPLTGVTLPFISYGGSSLLVSFIMIGILLRLSSRAR